MSKRATVVIGVIAVLAVLTGTALAMRSAGIGGNLFGQGAQQAAAGPLDGAGAVLLAKLGELMGTTPSGLHELMADKTPAEVAASKGIERSTLKAAAMDALRTMLNNRVQEGVITAADVDPLLGLADPKVEAWLDHNEQMGDAVMGAGHMQGGHGGGDHEMMGGKTPAWAGWGQIQVPGK